MEDLMRRKVKREFARWWSGLRPEYTMQIPRKMLLEGAFVAGASFAMKEVHQKLDRLDDLE